MPEHVNIQDPNIHEPKGIATAHAGEAYIADGAGSGAWTELGGATYGELQINPTASPIAITQMATSLDTATDYNKVNATDLWAAGESNDMTVSAVNGTITVVNPGLYIITFWASFTADVLNAVVAFKYSTDDTNGSLSTRRLTRKSGSTTDIGSVSGTGFVNLAAGDVISLWAATDLASVDVTFYSAGITAVLLKAS